jgi:hypothetical protein
MGLDQRHTLPIASTQISESCGGCEYRYELFYLIITIRCLLLLIRMLCEACPARKSMTRDNKDNNSNDSGRIL